MEFVAALKEDILLIAPRLDKLLTYKYVTRVNEHPMSPLERSPFILTPKGLKYLEETPHYKAPNPTRESHQPAASRPSEPTYKPDELAVKVLRYIYHDEGINPVEDLSQQLSVAPLEIEVRLDKLIEHGYVDHNELALLRGNNPYSLTDEGKEYLLKTPNRIVPFPSGDDILDDSKIIILRAIANANTAPTEAWLVAATLLHLVRLQVHLSDLCQHGYLGITYNEWMEPIYHLKDRAKRFLINHNLID